MNFSRRYCHILAGLGLALLLCCLGLGFGATTNAQGATTGWTAVPAGPQSSGSHLLLGTSCPNAWSCWAVGAMLPAGNGGPDTVAFAEHWDGSSWSAAPVAHPADGGGSVLYDVACLSSSDCWAVGAQGSGDHSHTPPQPMAEHWNGTAWSMVAVPAMTGFLFSVACPTADDCWATGSTFDPASGNPLHSYVVHWNGSGWSTVPFPSSGQSYDQLTGVSCASSSDCWAVGTAGPNPMGGAIIPNVFLQTKDDDPWIVHWNGRTWSGTPTPDVSSPTGAMLSGVTCASSSECWAVGSTMDANTHPFRPLVERWNGVTWVPTPVPAIGTNETLANVACATVTECWAVGASGDNSNTPNTPPDLTGTIERWDGTAWSTETTPNDAPLSYLYGVACNRGSQCFATGTVGQADGSGNVDLQPLIERTDAPAVGGQGFIAVSADGGAFNFGAAGFYGSTGGLPLAAPVVATASTPDGGGYWLVGTDGGVFAFGDAGFFGSMGGVRLNAPIVGTAATPDGQGYWTVAADGGVFAFGDAGFFGSMGGAHLNAPIVGMAATPDGGGYWLIAADGGVFAFGDAGFFGSMGGGLAHDRAVGLAPTPDGGGYWLVGADGGVFAFGDAGFFGSVPGQGLVTATPVTGISVSPNGRGYWLVTAAGAVYDYGNAGWLGSLSGIALRTPITGVSGPA